MDKLEFHELANLFPLMDEAELQELVDDIKRTGLLEPITLFEGKILDGRNRYLGCLRAGIQFIEAIPIANFKGTVEEAIGFVISKNFNRRHLTAGQRAALGKKLYALKQQGPAGEETDRSAIADRPRKAGKQKPSKHAMREAAAKSGSSVDSIEKFRAIETKDPELAVAVASGKKTLHQAESELKAKGPQATGAIQPSRARAQQQWHKPSPLEKENLRLVARVRELEAMVLPLEDSQKDALRQYKRQVDREYKIRWKLHEALVEKRAITMHGKDYSLFLAGFHPDASAEMRDKARIRFEALCKKHVIADKDKVTWPPPTTTASANPKKP